MKKLHFFKTDIPEHIMQEYLSSKEFKKDLVLQNIRRGKLLAIIIIAWEVVISSIDIISCLLHVDDDFPYTEYLAMYSLMIAINLAFLFLVHGYRAGSLSVNTMHRCCILFITFVMVWGSVIS